MVFGTDMKVTGYTQITPKETKFRVKTIPEGEELSFLSGLVLTGERMGLGVSVSHEGKSYLFMKWEVEEV